MDSLSGDIGRSPATRTDWDRLAAAPQFQVLLAAKKSFIHPAFRLFLVYCFTLPVLVGLALHFMSTKVMGGANLAFLFAPSLFWRRTGRRVDGFLRKQRRSQRDGGARC